jgi:NADH dehydrogenase
MGRLLAITGASGYIGRQLVVRATEAGWRVITLGRGAPPFPNLVHLHFDLESPAFPAFPERPDALIHLAYDTTEATAEKADIPAAWVLADGLKDSGGEMRLVFVSSQTASHAAPTAYGRGKAAVEDILRSVGAIVVRPGLVFGGPQAGLWRSMSRLVARAPILPALSPAPLVQPIHVDDLCSALLATAERVGGPGQIMAVAAPEAITITQFLRTLAAHGRRRLPIFIPVPTPMLLLATRAAAAFLPALRPHAQKLRSLTKLPPLASTPDLVALGVTPRSLAKGIGGEVAVRKALLTEAAALLRHIMGVRPSPYTLRRYVRNCERLGLEALPALPGPWKLRLVTPSLAEEAIAAFGLPPALKSRLQLALGVADTTPSTASLFYQTKPRPALVSGLQLGLAAFGEIPFLLWRLLWHAGSKAVR